MVRSLFKFISRYMIKNRGGEKVMGRKVRDVFIAGGMPEITYVSREELDLEKN